MKKEMEDFEQRLENEGRKQAIIQYYRTHARQILLGVASVGVLIILALSSLPVWARYSVVLSLLAANYIYGRYKENAAS